MVFHPLLDNNVNNGLFHYEAPSVILLIFSSYDMDIQSNPKALPNRILSSVEISIEPK